MEKNKNYITLQAFLKIKDLIPTGGYAKIFLSTNQVYVNNELETRRGRKLYKGDLVKIGNNEFEVTEDYKD